MNEKFLSLTDLAVLDNVLEEPGEIVDLGEVLHVVRVTRSDRLISARPPSTDCDSRQAASPPALAPHMAEYGKLI